MMKRDLGEALKNEKVQALKPKVPCLVQSETTLTQVVALMVKEKNGCVVVQNQGKRAGIFTERDLMTRVIEPGLDPRTKVGEVMTPKPKTLSVESPVSEAIRMMSQGGYRHIPIVNRQGGVEGVLSVKAVIRYLAEHFPCEIYNLPPDPHQVQRSREGA